MALLPEVFNCQDHEPMGDFEPIPDAWYKFVFAKSEVKKTKDGKGKILKLQASVIGGGELKEDGSSKYEKRIVFVQLNIQNKSKQAVEISMRELRSINDAVGIESLEDSVELHDIEFWGKVVTEKSEGYADKNKIKTYLSESDFKEKFK